MDSPTPPPRAWARLKADGPFPLRRGAWYKVSEATNIMVELDVHGEPIALPATLFDVVDHRPDRWTVVPRPERALVFPPESWGAHYGVCPSCAHRAPLLGSPDEMACTWCGLSVPVAWDESYLGRAPVRPGDAHQ